MIVYDLTCPHTHHFEGWYDSAETFERLQTQGLIECPVCQSKAIKRLPSALFIGTSIPKSTDNNTHQVEENQAALAQSSLVETIKQQVLQLIISSTEDVGTDFVETAKKIYYQEIPEKNIRGVASIDELEELKNEGIDVLVIGSTTDNEFKH